MALSDPIKILKKIDKAFDSGLVSCTDQLSIAKREKVIALRKEIKQAIDDGEVLARARTVSDKLSPMVKLALEGYL